MADSGDFLNSFLIVGDPDQGGLRTDNFGYGFSGFDSGDRFAFSVDLDLDTGDSGADLREIYFNNGETVPNAVFNVVFEIGGRTRTVGLTLPDDPLVGDPQVFDFAVSQFIRAGDFDLDGDVDADDIDFYSGNLGQSASGDLARLDPVSYTHLTLPTILRV